MADTHAIDKSEALHRTVAEYQRRERALSALVAGTVIAVFVGTYIVTALIPAVLVGVALLGVTRAPVLQPQGNTRLETSETVSTVADAFADSKPPILVFQWGIADDITTEETATTYHFSYLFGQQSTSMTVDTQTETSNGTRTVELEITQGDQPWGTYTVTIFEQNGRTIAEYEYTSNRRFGLRYLPQRLLSQRYRTTALEQQGYTVLEREDGLF
jgi:hypothetical protein